MNLVVPEKLVIELKQAADSASPAQVLHLPSEKISVELKQPSEPKSKWQRAAEISKDFGPTLTGLVSLVIAFLAFYYGYQINKRQAKSQEEQVEAQKRQAKIAEEESRLKFLSELNNSIFQLSKEGDERTRTVAAIKLAQYGEVALEPLNLALGVEETSVQEGAAFVVVQMFQLQTVERQKLFSSLLEGFRTPSPYLRRGVLECFIKMGKRLKQGEGQQVINCIKEQLDCRADCSRREDENLLLEAATFLDIWPCTASKELLLQIAENSSCLRPRIQVVDNLPKLAEKLPPVERDEIINNLQRLRKDAPDALRLSIDVTLQQIKATKDS
jgi:hypothetical protein